MVGETIFENINRKRQIHKLEISEIPCLRCGTCCSKFQPRLDLSEAHIIADKLGVSWESFLAEYVDRRWPGTRSILIRQIDGTCIFLRTSADKKQKLCLIHGYKPSCCQEWKSGLDRSECLDGLKTNWGLTLDSSARISGTQEKIEAFEHFVQSLKNPSGS